MFIVKKAIMTLIVVTITTFADPFSAAVDAYNKGNYVQALNTFYALAKKGDAKAQYNVALIYENGKGVKIDLAEAMTWYEKSAKQGNAAAAYNLGHSYQETGEQ